MSKASAKAGQSKEASAKDRDLDTYDAVAPEKRVVQRDRSGAEGTGPVSFDYMKEKDKRYFQAKRILAQGLAGEANESPYGKVHADKRDIKLLADRLKNLEYAHKDEWISKHVDWTNPSSIAVWRNAAPDFWERRVEYLRKTIDIQGRLAMIVTKGFPTTPEEVELLYLVDTGQLNVYDKGPHMLAVETPGGGAPEIRRGWIHNFIAGVNRPKTKGTPGDIIRGLRHPWEAAVRAGAPGGDARVNAMDASLTGGAGAASATLFQQGA